jgi:hypothetical protein
MSVIVTVGWIYLPVDGDKLAPYAGGSAYTEDREVLD